METDADGSVPSTLPPPTTEESNYTKSMGTSTIGLTATTPDERQSSTVTMELMETATTSITQKSDAAKLFKIKPLFIIVSCIFLLFYHLIR